MRKYGKFLLLVAAAALAAMAIGAASASAATVNNPGSHAVMTTNLTLTGGIGTIGTFHCQLSMTFYISSNADMIFTGWTPTSCMPGGTTHTPSNLPPGSDPITGLPSTPSPWNPGGVWKDWTGNVSGGGPNDWTGTLHNVQFSVQTAFPFVASCSYKGDMNLTYHNGATDPDGTFTMSGTMPRFSGPSSTCGTALNLSTTDTTVNPPVSHPFTFSPGDPGFTIS